MEYTSKQKEHITHCFDSFCKTVIRHCAMNLYRERDRQIKRTIVFDEIYTEYSEQCGKCDIYPILQYQFVIFGNVFSVNDYRLGQALSTLTDKQRNIILLYYFAGYSIRNIADMYGVSHQNISYVHIKALKKLREFLEADNEK